ncbi:ABC transporter permease [Pseudaestuariivita rosea]|uniref:ABC transporter permease n=1 Tax=Pseudaestuariivita rosea TaxID=2763263 RepID=UPI001ABA13AE|nr:ABC transporter permease [Pseudaestuariivita rosea]
MFQFEARPYARRPAVSFFELVYHGAVRNVRKKHGNAVLSILLNMLQTVLMCVIFYVLFSVLGLRASAIRGDFMLFVMSGVFLLFTHNAAMGAVVGSEGPASPMMQHAPMSTAIAICSGAIGSLYVQILSMIFVLLVYHIAVTPIEILNPVGAFGMVLLSWLSGVALGLVFLALKPWAPGTVGLISTIYRRVNMFTSGKMFLANMLPGSLRMLFEWNPLFHTIDQARGFIFINYFPRNTNIEYAIYFSIVFITLGLIGEFYTRKHASASWSARK